MDALVSIKSLKKYFPTRTGTLHAVDNVTFEIQKGTTLGVVGESGCGKSTLGRVILHLLNRTGGQIFFEGQDISDVSKPYMHELRKSMQIIFQDPFSSIDPRMTVSQLLGEPLEIYKLYADKEDYKKQVSDMMEVVGLSKRLENHYPHELDGGRRQRIGIGRALMLNPKFVVCDEPVSALDVSIQAQILNLMQDLQENLGLTYMFITHDLSVVRHISDEIVVMYLGVVVEKTGAKAIFKKQLHPYTKALISAIPRARVKPGEKSGRIILKGEIASPIDPPNACRFEPRCSYAREICRERAPELVQIEPHHFVACHRVKEINNI